MKFLIYLPIILLCCSCMNQVDWMVKDHPKKGTQHFYMLSALGGQHAAESSAGTRYTGTLEKSFADAAQAAVAKWGFDFQTKKVLSDNLTRRLEMNQITLRQKIALDAALAESSSLQDFQLAMAQILKTP